jgi:hypothetical protein
MDPRGPDQRRKQLVQRLAQQYAVSTRHASRVPMPARIGAQMSEGRLFRGASTSRAGGKASITQAPNILQSVLARLGVVGKSHAEEMSGGPGLPISPSVPEAGMPIPPQGSAIPTPVQGIDPTTGAIDPSSPYASGSVAPPGYQPYEDPTHVMVDPSSLDGSSGPVPLGNGLYYDPSTGMILGQQMTPDAGAATRALPRGGSAIPV